MEIVITQWGLDSYLDLKHRRTFSTEEYEGTLRPDVMRLKSYPNDPKFRIAKFWSQTVPDGFKMRLS